ncbi:MAG TPA: sulfatase-like hydrolase/transferase [Pirellulales bacterium]|nr:sulfatase-like hydrolase/transferase [Pirellulales bacterium]
MPPDRNVICVVLDGLQPAFLGSYGNTWISTPALDRLAAQSFVCDAALTDTLDLARVYRGYWQGLPAIWPDRAAPVGPSLVDRANQAGLETLLFTDDQEVAELPAAASFSQRTLLAVDESTQPAAEVADTQAMRYLAEASALLAEVRQPFLLWMHARGLSGVWDAPYALRSQYADEEDPPPPDWMAPKWRTTEDDIDPDELLGLMHAYAGQVSLWDACLETWLEEFAASALARNTLLAFFSPRGYPLAEHRHIGRIAPDLYSESVQTVGWWRFPDGLGAPARTPAIVLPADVPPTISEWLGWSGLGWPAAGHSLLPLARWERGAVREAAVLFAEPDRWALRTPAWHLMVSGEGEQQQVELYAKPADRYEVNDVAMRAADIAAGLSEGLQHARTNPTIELTGLEPALVTVVD